MPHATRILLVDDVPMFRDLGSVFLSRTGPVDLAETAAAAYRCAEERPPTVVIADMHLPDASGAELCRRFKAHSAWGRPRVVLLARPHSPEDHAEAVRAGADEVLFKPLERDTLIATVRRLTDYESPRGLPRARIERPIEIATRDRRVEARLCNVSRGGLFVASPLHLDRAEEVRVQFSLSADDAIVSPTARVVWSQATPEGVDRIGLRFLEIDARTVARLDHYVSDHFPRLPSLPA